MAALDMFGALFALNDQLSVNPENLAADASQLLDEIAVIETKFNKMYEDVKSLGNMWNGVTKSVFTSNFESDYLKAKEFLDSLQEYAHRLDNESKEYRNCENKVIEKVGNI